ncbi:MAG: NUDIX hydrolase [Candidatus Nanopelagicales bacterium]
MGERPASRPWADSTGGQDERWHGVVADVADPWPTVGSTQRFDGAVWSVVTDQVQTPSGHIIDRDVVRHPGAVGIAVVDEDDRVLLIRQYRQPVGGYLFELPAGLRDVADEHPLTTAQRELAEEAGLTAARWDVLIDFFNSPGGSTEAFRCFLARDPAEIPGGRMRSVEAEEAHLPAVWIPIDDVVDLVLTGKLHNPSTVTGVLALAAARNKDWATLRPAESNMWQLPSLTDPVI